MLIVLAEAKMGEGTIDAAREAMEEMITTSRAEEGCIGYAYATDILDPLTLHIVEKWVDDDALAFHFQTPHMAAFQQAISKLDLKITQLAKYQADNGSAVM